MYDRHMNHNRNKYLQLKQKKVWHIRSLSLSIAIFVSFLFPQTSQANESCVRALIQDKAVLILNESVSLSMLSLLQSASGNRDGWEASIDVPIKAGTLGIGAGAISEATNNFFKHSQLQWNEERLVSVATQTLSRNSVDAYRTCVEGSHSDGVRVLVHNSTKTGSSITIRWIAGVGQATETDDINISISGGTLLGQFPTNWKNGQSASRIVERTPKQDLRITVDIEGNSDTAFVSQIPEVTEPPKSLKIGSCRGAGPLAAFRYWGPPSENCLGFHDVLLWGKYDSQVQNISQMGSCMGQGIYNGFRFFGPVGEDCLGVANWGKYKNPIDITEIGYSSCNGQGDFVLHRYWAPHSETCLGYGPWGIHDEYRQQPQ